jgi:MoxR-like ATPase
MEDCVTREISTDDSSEPVEVMGAVDASCERLRLLQTGILTVLKGKTDVAKLATVALIAKGHLLIEDVPGIGKTTLANALARSIGLSFQRVQFTSDLLPSDLTGLSIFKQSTGEFEWRQGPIFSNIVLADEINRATPKTQSALLEAMAEGHVTNDGVTRPLPAPFMVIATQNPAEHHGTYPLPESQLDRFAMRIKIGYPDRGSELEMIKERNIREPVDDIQAVLTSDELVSIQERVRGVHVSDDLVAYLLEIVERTRQPELFEIGVSPRGSLSLHRCAQAMALIEGRDFCIPDDIKGMAVPVLAHRVRVAVKSGIRSTGVADSTEALLTILDSVPVPV